MNEIIVRLPLVFSWAMRPFQIVFSRFKGVGINDLLIRAVAITLLALLFGGRSVSKFQLFGPIYIVDFLFLLITAITLVKSRFKFVWPIYFNTFVIVFIIFLSSFFRSDAPIDIIIRQFVLFIYAFSSYVVVGYLTSVNKKDDLKNLLVGLAAFSVVSQTFYLVFLLVSGKFVFGGFNYLSPVVVCGVIIWVCYLFSERKLSLSVLPSWLFALFLSFSFGHSSAVMAVGLIPFFYILLNTELKYRIYSLGLILILLGMFFYIFPQIIDDNASWRLVYWNIALNNIFSGMNWLFGFGFGQLYADEAARYIFLEIFGSSNDLQFENEGYYKAFHNSYITIFFHIGLLSIVFYITQIKAIFAKRSFYNNKENTFLGLSALGLAVWAYFNVVLELPHSAHYYWLVIFMCYHSQKRNGL